MSATVDLSPLKMETPSPHPSPHRGTPLRSSSLGSPREEDAMAPTSSPAGTFSSSIMEFGRVDPSPVYSTSGSDSVMRNGFRPVMDSEMSGEPMSVDDDSPPPSPSPSAKAGPESVETDRPLTPPATFPATSNSYLYGNAPEPDDASRDVSSPSYRSPSLPDTRRAQHSPLESEEFPRSPSPDVREVERPAESMSSDCIQSKPDDSDDVIDCCDDDSSAKPTSEVEPSRRGSGDNGDVSDKEEEDQIECAECSVVFSNLQRYMDHTCYRSHPAAPVPPSPADLTTTVSGRAERHPVKTPPISSPYDFRDEPKSDTRCFYGNMVYNPDGSVYVMEAGRSSSDGDIEMARLNIPLSADSILVKRHQSVLSVDRSIPQLTTAVFFPTNGPSSVLSACLDNPDSSTDPHNVSQSSLSFKVFCLQSVPAERLLHHLASHPRRRFPARSVLMCFICKLFYELPKTFLKHAMLEHSILFNDSEKTLIDLPSTSAIIHAVGKMKEPMVSVLQPCVRHESQRIVDRTESGPYSFVSSRDVVHPTLSVNLNYMPPGIEDKDSLNHIGMSSFDSERRASSDRVSSYKHSPLSLSQREELSSIQRSSTPLNMKGNNFLKENYYRPSPPVPSPGDKPPTGHFLLPPHSIAMDNPSALALRSSPSQRVSSSPAASTTSGPPDPSFLTSAPSSLSHLVTASSLASSVRVLPSSAPANLPPLLTLPSSAQTSLPPPLGLTLPNFLGGTCDEHPQGKAQGVECPKCDMILSSSQSLGGHMTMTHSRNSCKTLKCPKCNWHYKYQETLEIHMKEKHPDSDAQCVYCLTNQAHPRLARGESYSCGYKPYRCEVCNYSTTTKGNLSIHMQSDKHINNMQDLANGSAELKMTAQQPTTAQSLPPSAPPPIPPTNVPPSSYSQEDQQYKKLKQKQSFRCDVCSYETSVARNLRIHMTSEKHTHNMLVMSQSISHLHQDMTLHQMSQMNQLLALNQQDHAARFAAMGAHIPGNLFYEQAAMLMSAAASNVPPPPHPPHHPPPPHSAPGFEIPMNLTKENGFDDGCGGPSNNKDASKMFQCAVCNKYSSDSMENVHNHIQYDRTKNGNPDAHVTFSNGTYHCNLCSYKTHLKANFQLHCKTDKHLQKLQLINHIQEGGLENEWRLTYPGSPMQICCNACSFYANSTHKMQLHASTIQHESCAQLFRHLQLLDRATPPAGPGRQRFYQCTLCPANVRTKQRLVLHSRSPQHVRKEQLMLQGQVSIFDVYVIKEMTDGDNVDFEEEGKFVSLSMSLSLQITDETASCVLQNRSEISLETMGELFQVRLCDTDLEKDNCSVVDLRDVQSLLQNIGSNVWRRLSNMRTGSGDSEEMSHSLTKAVFA
ncbi:zinc finger homeobox protein 4-like [Aplysia californica]|uniref:Zinc finger homeobox protein 4-like n=1 Tax=Aplysia californica TaxID=6500 RepID=A0ABM1VRE9_APLCA|nr:zinc finger homeobox protein 4-like [Aplysia californica]